VATADAEVAEKPTATQTLRLQLEATEMIHREAVTETRTGHRHAEILTVSVDQRGLGARAAGAPSMTSIAKRGYGTAKESSTSVEDTCVGKNVYTFPQNMTEVGLASADPSATTYRDGAHL